MQERAARLRRYREHFTIIFAETAARAYFPETPATRPRLYVTARIRHGAPTNEPGALLARATESFMGAPTRPVLHAQQRAEAEAPQFETVHPPPTPVEAPQAGPTQAQPRRAAPPLTFADVLALNRRDDPEEQPWEDRDGQTGGAERPDVPEPAPNPEPEAAFGEEQLPPQPVQNVQPDQGLPTPDEPVGVESAPTEPEIGADVTASETPRIHEELTEIIGRLGGNGVEVLLPRRPRPVPLKPLVQPEPEVFRPETTPQEAQSWLARLNKVSEAERSGESTFQPLSYDQMLNWSKKKNPATAEVDASGIGVRPEVALLGAELNAAPRPAERPSIFLNGAADEGTRPPTAAFQSPGRDMALPTGENAAPSTEVPRTEPILGRAVSSPERLDPTSVSPATRASETPLADGAHLPLSPAPQHTLPSEEPAFEVSGQTAVQAARPAMPNEDVQNGGTPEQQALNRPDGLIPEERRPDIQTGLVEPQSRQAVISKPKSNQAERVREELTALVERLGGDKGIEVVLPRRPRPVPLKPAIKAVPETVLPQTTPEEAQAWLSRLNKVSEAERSGESAFQPLSYDRMLNWQPRRADEVPDTADPDFQASLEPGEVSALGRTLDAPEQTILEETPEERSEGAQLPTAFTAPTEFAPPPFKEDVAPSAVSSAFRPARVRGKPTAPDLPRPAPVPLIPQQRALQRVLARALRADRPAETLPESVRGQLAPLLGADAVGVRLLRGEGAAEATAAANADALAVGDTVLLAPGHDLGSPRTLGVLAHELTHVVRRRDPGFVPATLRSAPASSPTDEETLALRVEGRVRAHFEAAPRTRPVTTAERDLPDQAQPSAGTWGGLPAPWEPLPYWDAADPDRVPAPSAPVPHLPAVSVPNMSTDAPPLPGVQAASLERAVPKKAASDDLPGQGAKSALKPNEPARHEGAGTPDLDQLAQQVYGLLKRRLATELRRVGG